jgi:uncharacterized protein VirK/YbjX
MVAYLTGIRQEYIKKRYKKMNGESSAGKWSIRQPKIFAMQGPNSSQKFLLASSLFAVVYLNLEKAFNQPTHRGWLLAHAYRVYQKLTRTFPLSKFDLVDALSISAHLGRGHATHLARLVLRTCPKCYMQHLFATEFEDQKQECPFCALNLRYANLAKKATEIAVKRRVTEGNAADLMTKASTPLL